MFKIAFAGTGYISKIHAQAAQKLPDVALSAVVNHRPESMAAFADGLNIPRQYATIETLLHDGGVDAISINTPNYLHAPQAIAALEAGVHVMVEKPMAMNATEARAMVDAAEKSGVLLMVAHCWRFDTEVLWLKEHADAGKLGRIVRTKSYGVHANWGPGGWFTQKLYAGGGALADMGIHALDTTRFLLDDPLPLSVYAQVGIHYKDFIPQGRLADVDDTGIIIVNWDNGVSSYVESGWWQPHCDGPKAATQLYGLEGFGSVFPTLLKLPNPAQERVDEVDGGFAHPRENQCPQEMYDHQMAHFVQCVREGRAPNPGGAEGLVNMQIVDAACESSRTCQVVEIR